MALSPGATLGVYSISGVGHAVRVPATTGEVG